MSQNLLFRDKNFTNALVNIQGFDVGGTIDRFPQLTIKEIVMGESLLTPGLQTSVTIQSQLYTGTYKNFDEWKNQNLTFSLYKIDGNNNPYDLMKVNQKVYRLDNRDFMPVNVGQTEEFTIHACDQTLLNDAKTLVSKSWKCTTPSDVVGYVLQSCAGAQYTDIEDCDPSRDYIAENIHPFQVVAQQGNVALADGNDPSFVHYMTYGQLGQGIHHFRSLKTLCNQAPIETFVHGETGIDGGGYQNRNVVLAFMFPCDYDYLSDLLNGLDENGQNMNTVALFNPLNLSAFQVGNSSGGCGIGGFNFKAAMSNSGTSQQMDSCNYEVEKYLLKRQARMSLLERDKVALRMTVPWNPNVHAGSVIRLDWKDRNGYPVYGFGNYLVSSMKHTIRLGGFSVTSMDCVSTSVAGGIV